MVSDQGNQHSVVARYRLPVTTVRITGTRARVVNRKSMPAIDTVSRSATAITQINADHRLWLTFTDPGPVDRPWRRDLERDLNLSVKPDGRLQSLNATVTDTSTDRLKAALQIGAGVTGAVGGLLIPAGPWGAAIGVATGVATGVIAYNARAVLPIDGEAVTKALEGGDGTPSRPAMEKLGIPPAYSAENKDAAELLANLKWSEVQLLDAIARATPAHDLTAPQQLASQLRHLQRCLVAVREALVESERDCLGWVAQQAVVTNTVFDEVLTIDEVPTTSELHATVSAHFPADDKRRWIDLFKTLRFAVTCDLLDPDIDQNRTLRTDVPKSSDTTIWYRRPRLATVTHWEIVKSGTSSVATPTLVERKLVVIPGDEEPLQVVPDKGAGTATVTFDGDGLLTGHATHVKDASVDRLKALADSPALVKDALASGAAVAEGLTTSDAEKAARAKSALELVKVAKELQAARGPAGVDRLKQIREELEEAELMARLAKARMVISDPTMSVVEIYSVAPTA